MLTQRHELTAIWAYAARTVYFLNHMTRASSWSMTFP